MTNEWNNSWATPQPTPQPFVTQPSAVNPLDQLNQDQLLMKWQELKDALAKAKEQEMELRKYIVSRVFPESHEGTNKLELGGGYELKAAIKYNYNLDPDINKVEAALDQISKIGNIGPFMANRLVKWSASFLLTEYRVLQAADASEDEKAIKKIIDGVLTITEAAPGLEIREPRSKKK
jgi:hypothetical protein